MTTAILLAGGRSTRMGASVDKAFLSLVNKPVLAWSLLAFEKSPKIDRIVLVVRKEQVVASKAVVKMFGISKIEKIVPGGAKRQESVLAGLAACDPETRLVVIHDAARPCVTPDMIAAVLAPVAPNTSATVGRPVTDTLKNCAKVSVVTATVPREHLWAVQTPQAFNISELRAAYRKLPPKTEVTDDCQVIERAGGTVKIVETLSPNIKVTVPDDLLVASKLLK